MTDGDLRGLIFDMENFAVHDGPGCRTIVFFSGCPLRCSWCANPEGQRPYPRLMHLKSRCRSCFSCASACPSGAVRIPSAPGRYPLIDRAMCDSCVDPVCIEFCPGGALRMAGKHRTLDEVMRILKRDRFYWGSRGGVTLSGGEPFAQSRFLKALLAACRDAYMHTALETCGFVETGIFLETVSLADWLFFDLKHLDPEAHRLGTGADNDLILENLKRLIGSDWKGRLVVRMTLVPGFNDDAGHLGRLADFLKSIGSPEIQLISLHRLASSKYEQLGLPDPFAEYTPVDEGELELRKKIFAKRGLNCQAGNGVFF